MKSSMRKDVQKDLGFEKGRSKVARVHIASFDHLVYFYAFNLLANDTANDTEYLKTSIGGYPR